MKSRDFHAVNGKSQRRVAGVTQAREARGGRLVCPGMAADDRTQWRSRCESVAPRGRRGGCVNGSEDGVRQDGMLCDGENHRDSRMGASGDRLGVGLGTRRTSIFLKSRIIKFNKSHA